MTKDVLLSIKGLQIGENEQNDTIEVISPGDYYFRNGKHFFMYEEVMEGQKESTSHVRYADIRSVPAEISYILHCILLLQDLYLFPVQ